MSFYANLPDRVVTAAWCLRPPPLAAVGQIVGGAGANGPALVNPVDRATANSLMRAMRFSDELCPPDQDATLGLRLAIHAVLDQSSSPAYYQAFALRKVITPLLY